MKKSGPTLVFCSTVAFFSYLSFTKSDETTTVVSNPNASSEVASSDQRCPTLKSPFGSVEIFPADNVWNQPIDHLPVHPNSDAWINTLGKDTPVHPDWGNMWNGMPLGIPVNVVRGTQPRVPVRFEWPGESDEGLYPIPDNVLIEGGNDGTGDRHAIIVDYDNKKLYELYNTHKSKLGWTASSGAIFDLTSNQSRPKGWTSADAAGLPILPGLVRYDEVVEKQEIRHALRFTVKRSQRGYIFPARHFASSSKDTRHIPMGMRMRLKADYDCSGFPKSVQVILEALKKYGMIVADNGSDLFITGVHDSRWNADELAALKRVKATDLEAVYTGEIDTTN